MHPRDGNILYCMLVFFLFSCLLTSSCKKATLRCYLNVIVVSVGALAILCGASTGLLLLSCYHHMLSDPEASLHSYNSSFTQEFFIPQFLFLAGLSSVAGCLVKGTVCYFIWKRSSYCTTEEHLPQLR